MKMSGFFSNLARTFSDEVKAYTSSHPVRGAAAGQLHAPGYEEHDHAGPAPHPAPVATSIASSAPIAVPRSASSMESCASSCPGSSPPGTPMGAEDGKRKPYKIHGMDAYDYWSLIRSL